MAAYVKHRARDSGVTGTFIAVLVVALVLLSMVILAAPISTRAQALFGISAILLIALLKPVAHKALPRFAILSVAGLVVLHYWFWRVFFTLPTVGPTLSFGFGVLLLAVETYAIYVFFVSVFISADMTERTMPERIDPAQLPTVDLFIPSYNEPANLLATTLAAAKNIHYPKHLLNVTLCDDGGTEAKCNSSDSAAAADARARRTELQKLCEDLGVNYFTRSENSHAKAGNLNAAMACSEGELVAIFDADHVPSNDFLARTVGYFAKDPDLFLVQTPHFFLNDDPIQRNIGLSADCPPEYEMFYAKIHRGLDNWNGAFFCGSAALLRRRALDEIGGISTVTVTEDAETTLDLHSRGWNSLYINHAMVAGLQPETFASFVKQRGRWAAGMLQILLLKNPIFRRGLTFAQRLCYLNSISFWFFPIVRMVFLLAPLLYLFFGIEVFVASFQQSGAYVLTYLLVSFMVQNALYHDLRWPLISEVYEVAQAPYLMKVVFGVFFRPRSFSFNVTAKDEMVTHGFISTLYRPLLILFLVEGAGIAAAALRWFMYPDRHQVVAAIGAWAVFNFILVSSALGAVSERQQRRAFPRVLMKDPVRIRLNPDELAAEDDEAEDAFDDVLNGTILDASLNGARLLVPNRSDAGWTPKVQAEDHMRLQFHIEDAPQLDAWVAAHVRSVRQVSKGYIVGIEFETADDPQAKETVACLVFSNSERWRSARLARQKSRGVIRGFMFVISLAITTVPKVLSDLLMKPKEGDGDAPEEEIEQIVPAHIYAFGEDFDEQAQSGRAKKRLPDAFKSAMTRTANSRAS